MASVVPLPAVGRRVWASSCDLLVIAGWFALLTLTGVAIRAFLPSTQVTPPTEAPVGVDVAVFAATVLPVGLYLAIGEAGHRQASWGKRRAGLRTTVDGRRPSPWRIALRTAVKLLPWQLGHIAVARLILGVDDPVTSWTTYALSLAIPVVSVAWALRDPQRRALHDRVAGTRVECVRDGGGPAARRRGW